MTVLPLQKCLFSFFCLRGRIEQTRFLIKTSTPITINFYCKRSVSNIIQKLFVHIDDKDLKNNVVEIRKGQNSTKNLPQNFYVFLLYFYFQLHISSKRNYLFFSSLKFLSKQNKTKKHLGCGYSFFGFHMKQNQLLEFFRERQHLSHEKETFKYYATLMVDRSFTLAIM